MEASLDTNVIIHLYNANYQSILFNRFKKVKVYEFIRNHEMVNHATSEVIDLFDKDVQAGNRIDKAGQDNVGPGNTNIGIYILTNYRC